MLYNWKEITAQYGYPLKVRQALNKGEIYKVGHGLYSEKPHINPFTLISAKYPYTIVTMDTAFYIYGLSDVIPEKTHLATMRNATRINDPLVKQAFLSAKIFEAGKTQLKYEGVTVTVYNRERMLVETLRNSKSMGLDYYKEIINSYRKISSDLDFHKIDEYISLFKKKDYLYDKIQKEIL